MAGDRKVASHMQELRRVNVTTIHEDDKQGTGIKRSKRQLLKTRKAIQNRGEIFGLDSS